MIEQCHRRLDERMAQLVAACGPLARGEATDPAVLPFDWYLEIVAAGADEHALPEAYRRRLREIPVRRDPDRHRARRFRALLEA